MNTAIFYSTYSPVAVNNRGLISLVFVLEASLLRHQGPEGIHIDGRAPVLLHGLVVVPHAHLTKVTWMAGKQKVQCCEIYGKAADY